MRRTLPALSMLICLSVLSHTALAEEAKLPMGGFITPHGSVYVDRESGSAVFTLPYPPREMQHGKLKHHSTADLVDWYRVEQTGYFIGVGREADHLDTHAVWVSFYAETGMWHTYLLGMSRRVPLGQ